MTSPTTQVNSSCRMMVKSSSSVRQSFMGSDKFYRMSPIQVVQHGPAISAGSHSFKKRFAFARILAGNVFVQLDAKARFLRERDKSVLDNGLRHSFDQIIPEGNIRSMEFEHEKIRDGSAEMRGSQSSDWTTDVVAPVAIDGDVRVSANGFVNGANQSNHAINRPICKPTVVRIRTFGARHVKIKLQSCVPLRPHRNRLLTVIVRRGWRGPLGLTEIIPRGLLAPVPHPRRLTRTKDFVQVFERFASMAIGIDSHLIPELSAEQSINRYL